VPVYVFLDLVFSSVFCIFVRVDALICRCLFVGGSLRLVTSVAVCCGVLQCVAVCCSVLQCVAGCCSVLQGVAVC